MSSAALAIRNAEVEGLAGQDVFIRDGRIVEVGPKLTSRAPEIDARGGALIPGLIDHHIHLLATAAQAESLFLDDVRSATGFAERLRAWVAVRPAGTWVRAVGYHERMAGLIGRADLDALAPDHPVRVQDQTGGLWILNSRALALVATGDTPPSVELGAGGVPTGRIWRGDAWLRTRIGRTPPPLAAVGAALAAKGVTGVMDASASTDADAAATLADAVRAGALPQRLGLMSAGGLDRPDDAAFAIGPLKVLLDERDLLPLDEFIDRIGFARVQNRHVAVHCVTAAELALAMAAFAAAGSRPGDRIEHGGVIAPGAIPVLAKLRLTVVTQPGFIFERGDRYLAEVEPGEHGDLYRCASLLGAGVPVAGSSDAPYSTPDPWAAMRAAVSRRTAGGRPIGPNERVSPRDALGLFLGGLDAPGGGVGRVAPGAAADLCLLKTPLNEALEALSADLVAAIFVGGRLAHEAR
jgi:predicted amidohydrolase YtcJ